MIRPPRKDKSAKRWRSERFARRIAVPLLCGALLAAALSPSSARSAAAPSDSSHSVESLALLPSLSSRDLPAKGRLFDRGIPVGKNAFSPDGYHFAYLHQVAGRFPRRRPERCVFLLDLGTLENRAVRTPKGRANRVGGWDPTGRYLLIETASPHILSPFTGRWTTYHWVFDVVTSQFPPRKPFTGVRGSERFRWKKDGTYHGVWDDAEGTTVVPLDQGELAERYEALESALLDETKRRTREATFYAVGSSAPTARTLDSDLARLDQHWTRRGQRDAVVSDLFGERPTLFIRRNDRWVEVAREIEYVAILDRGIALVTLEGGKQALVNRERGEIAPLASIPEAFAHQLAARWERPLGTYDEIDPLPRDLQYRRSADLTAGVVSYFNYVTTNSQHALLLYSIDATERVLRVVDLPEAWITKSANPRNDVPGP